MIVHLIEVLSHGRAAALVSRKAPIPWCAAACVCGLAFAAARGETAPGAAAEATPEQIHSLIAELGDDDYFVRERAQGALAKIGVEAFDALVEAEKHADLEVADRARFLVRQIQIDWVRDDDPLAVRKILERYGDADEKSRLAAIEALSRLPADAGVPALCRIARFDASMTASKLAALAVIEPPIDAKPMSPRPSGKASAAAELATDGDADWKKKREAILSAVGMSVRPTAEWLRAYASHRNDASAQLATWLRLAEAEERVVRANPATARPEPAMGLWRQVVRTAKRAGASDDAHDAMLHIIEFERGTDEGLTSLLEYLADESAWDLIDVTVERFSTQFDQQPLLWYTLASLYRDHGDTHSAQRAAARALALNDEDQTKHLIAAITLQQKGLLDWSDAEYRKAIDVGAPANVYTLQARYRLAEMLHDQADDARAAEALAPGVAELENNPARDASDFEPAELRARLLFFRACAAAAEGDRKKELALLRDGIEQYSVDADILISLYRSPEVSGEERADVQRLIDKAAEVFRKQIQSAPDDSTPYNQLAWLISNTTGDFREALRMSEKSLELRPRTAGYLDTLARCHFALGEYETALERQEEAVALEPHSGQMQRQLAEFRSKVEEETRKDEG